MGRVIRFLSGLFLLTVFIPSFSYAEFKNVRVVVWGTACAVCNNYIEGKFRHVPGIEKVIPNIKDSSFTLVPKPATQVDLAAITKAAKESGYTFKFIELTLSGKTEDLQGKSVLVETTSNQTFQLVQGNNLPLTPEKSAEIKQASDNGVKKIEVKGLASSTEGGNLLEPIQVSASE